MAPNTTETVATFDYFGRTYQVDHLGVAVGTQYGEYAIYRDGRQVAEFEVEDAFRATEHRQGLPATAELIKLAKAALELGR